MCSPSEQVNSSREQTVRRDRYEASSPSPQISLEKKYLELNVGFGFAAKVLVFAPLQTFVQFDNSFKTSSTCPSARWWCRWPSGPPRRSRSRCSSQSQQSVARSHRPRQIWIKSFVGLHFLDGMTCVTTLVTWSHFSRKSLDSMAYSGLTPKPQRRIRQHIWMRKASRKFTISLSFLGCSECPPYDI